MEFPELATLVEKLNECYRDDPCPGSVIGKSLMTSKDVERMEDACGVKLCGMLLHLLMTYDFGNVSIGWVNFGARKNNFQYLLEKNISPIVWWREDFPTMIAIAGTDGFGVFVDTVSQAVFASETGSREMFRIARDMETLLRAVGALAIAESLVITDDLVNEVAEFAGAPEGKRFWNG